MLTDLSKAFDCLSHELLAAKLIAYGVEILSVRLIYDYLKKRKQKTKIGNNYSSGVTVPIWSTTSLLLFNIYIRDMFFLLKNINVANYADDITPCIYCENIESVIKSLVQSANLLFNSFKNSQMKGNQDKYHLLLNTDQKVQVDIGTAHINNSKCAKLLGIKNYMQKDWHKTNALTRVAKHMNREKKRLIMNVFFSSQFNYCLFLHGCSIVSH